MTVATLLPVSISRLANGAFGEHRRHETHEPAPVLEVLEPQPIGWAFEPDIEIPRQRRVHLRPG
jgi:hypothetical protein